ncbi:MAG: DctP family TRAP transporter solute-binding subunit [Lachnospiraceae bacterium]|nr:DctP family TRAP transporter solute-binding subunit [Lachnospiraceae bacterium]
MRNWRRILAVMLAAAMALSATACSSSSSSSSDTTAAETEAAGDETTAAGDETTAAEGETEAASAGSSDLSYADYEASDVYVASEEAAVYEGTDEWPETYWYYTCSTGDTSTWAQAGYYFNALMQESTNGAVQIGVYASDQLTNGSQTDGIQALMDGATIQVSMHSNLIYANFDTRFNVVSLPYLFEDYDAVDTAMAGEGGEALKEVLAEYGLVCEGIGENGFRQITNSSKPITSVSDLADLKMRICSNDLCEEVYKEWGCDATVMNWSETYTALQQGTVDGQENPETAIDSASVQDVQSYISLWNAYYDCLFFCINQSAYDQFTDEQKAVIDENAAKAVAYQIAINRDNVEALVAEWTESGVMEVTTYDEIDTDSFKEACSGAEDWYIEQLVANGMTEDEATAYIDSFKAE